MMRERTDAVGEATTLAERKRRAGQQLLLAVEAADADTRYLARHLRPAGFLVHLDPDVEPAAWWELSRELAALCDPARPAVLAARGDLGWPSPATLARAEAHTTEIAAALADEVRALGWDLWLGPAGDLGPAGFSTRAELATRHTAAFVRAAARQGLSVAPTGFPGREGPGAAVEWELPDLTGALMRPFAAALAAGASALQLSAATYPALDEDAPVHRSPRVVSTLLRPRSTLVLGPLAPGDAPRDLALGAVDATVDLIPIGSDAPAVHATLVHAQESGSDLADAEARVHTWREATLLGAPRRPGLNVVGARPHRDLAALVRARGG